MLTRQSRYNLDLGEQKPLNSDACQLYHRFALLYIPSARRWMEHGTESKQESGESELIPGILNTHSLPRTLQELMGVSVVLEANYVAMSMATTFVQFSSISRLCI